MVDEQPVDFEQLPALVVREASQQLAQQEAARAHVLHHLLERRLSRVNRSERQLELHSFKRAKVLARTLDRCAELGLDTALLPRAADVDTPADLERLAQRLRRDPGCCPRTAALLAAWQPAVLPS